MAGRGGIQPCLRPASSRLASARDGRQWVLALQPGSRIAVLTGGPSSSREAAGDGGGTIFSGGRTRRGGAIPFERPGEGVLPSSLRLGFAMRGGGGSHRSHCPPPLGLPGASLEPVRGPRHGGVSAGEARGSAASSRLPSGLWDSPQGWAGCGAGWAPAALSGAGLSLSPVLPSSLPPRWRGQARACGLSGRVRVICWLSIHKLLGSVDRAALFALKAGSLLMLCPGT